MTLSPLQQQAEAAVELDETVAVVVGESTLTARRFTGEEPQPVIAGGSLGWYYQVLADGDVPAGFLFLHQCNGFEDRWRLGVQDPAWEPVAYLHGFGEPIPVPAWALSYGCKATALDALVELGEWMARESASR